MRNTILYWILILISVFVSYKFSKLLKTRVLIFIATYISLFLICEFLDIFVGLQTWSQYERTVNCYDWFVHYLKKNYGVDYDYTESLFLGNYDLTGAQATQQKYEYIFKKLDLAPGKSLLDFGSGVCTWLDFCRKKGVEVTGITLSTEQQEKCNKKGIKAIVSDFRILNKDLLGKFDAVSLLGSTEHITISSGYYQARANSYKDYKNVFEIAKQYLKPKGKIILTVLVQCKSVDEYSSWYDNAQAYVMDRYYGGYYSVPEILTKTILDNGLKLISIEDHTKDYHWISVVEPDHFGHWWINWSEDPVDKMTYFMRGLFTDPFLLHKWLYYGMDTWMWQFGGYQKTPLTDEQVKNAPANCKYFIIES